MKGLERRPGQVRTMVDDMPDPKGLIDQVNRVRTPV
jgi:hypothetical protein